MWPIRLRHRAIPATNNTTPGAGRMFHPRFTIQRASAGSAARLARLETPHGPVPTPLFMPVGTQASVKALDPGELRQLGAHIVLANTYHLWLRPGPEVVAAAGGLHRFSGWSGAMLTDSGGFQIFSLSPLRKIDDDGVTFRSHIDGSKLKLTPELAVQIQEQLGADIAMALDECAPYPCERRPAESALQRTHAWAVRCLAAHSRPDQTLFPIVQGSVYADLRRQSVRFLAELDAPGYALGGLCLGEPKPLMWQMVEESVAHLPAERPRYFMGLGTPEDFLEAVDRGVDLMDCVLPTRLARNGGLFTRQGRINLRNARWKRMDQPVDPACDCATCARYSAGYLHHLFRCGELLGHRLASIHNLRQLCRLAEETRAALAEERFPAFKRERLAQLHNE